MSAKTYDRQSGKLISRIAENLPEMSSDVMQGWINNPKALQKFLAELCTPNINRNRAQLAENCYKVLVDYGQTLQQMIANGKYDYANSDITASNFPPPAGGQGSGQQNVVVELVHFGRDMESEAVLKEFEARGLRAATLPELLAFGATYPEKQREFPIIALGSVWQDRYGNRSVPCLLRWGASRELDLLWDDDWWFGHCRFAAVRK